MRRPAAQSLLEPCLTQGLQGLQGSEMTFITENLAQQLRITRTRTSISISAIGGVNAGTYRHAAQIIVSPHNKTAPKFSIIALILKSLTAYASKRVDSDGTFDHLADLQWADHDPMSADPIEILIGADLYSEIILKGVRKGAPGHPIAQQSVFEWIISGPIVSSYTSSLTSTIVSGYDYHPIEVNTHLSRSYQVESLTLDKELRRFWEVEEIPGSTAQHPDDEQCEQHFQLIPAVMTVATWFVFPLKRSSPLISANLDRRRQRY